MDRLRAELGLNEAVTMDDLQAFAKRTKSRADGLIEALGKVIKLKRERAKIPARVPVGAVKAEVIKLAPERKHLTNLLKMVAYQAESDLVRLVAPHYQRVEDEGRTLIQNALASAADIEVCNDELRITLAPLSSPHRSRAIAALCDELNLRRVAYPGTRLRSSASSTAPSDRETGHFARTVCQEFWTPRDCDTLDNNPAGIGISEPLVKPVSGTGPRETATSLPTAKHFARNASTSAPSRCPARPLESRTTGQARSTNPSGDLAEAGYRLARDGSW